MRNRLGRNRRGVALLYFIMVIGIMLGFMMLVVNTGMLVYQKIRLQTAVDLASYAGASVQASYLGNRASDENSIRGINIAIQKRYAELTQKLLDMNKTPAPWYGLYTVDIPGAAGMEACALACAASNLLTSQTRVDAYRKAAEDLEQLRVMASRILDQLPQAAQIAAEVTMRLNIPELGVAGDEVFSDILSETTNKFEDVIKENKDTNTDGVLRKKKNAVLSFSSARGMYLANVVATVPHSYVFYGPFCSSKDKTKIYPYQDDSFWYCHVNGAGAGGGPLAYGLATVAFARSFTPPSVSGNIGNIQKITDKASRGIRLHFVQNANKPDPFFLSAAEWYPQNGSFMNLENSLGAKGSLFPKETRLVAVSAAEPFGGSLIGSLAPHFGTRLQSIRKILLDPRMKSAKEDFPGLYDYMETLAPLDEKGRPIEKSEDVIRRFLH